MIFNDETRTDGKQNYDESKWMEKYFPKHSILHLARVEMLYDKEDGRLIALKFWDKNDSVLLATEDFDDEDFEPTEEGRYKV